MPGHQVQDVGAVHQARHEQNYRIARPAVVEQPAAALLPDRRRILQNPLPRVAPVGCDPRDQRWIRRQARWCRPAAWIQAARRGAPVLPRGRPVAGRQGREHQVQHERPGSRRRPGPGASKRAITRSRQESSHSTRRLRPDLDQPRYPFLQLAVARRRRQLALPDSDPIQRSLPRIRAHRGNIPWPAISFAHGRVVWCTAPLVLAYESRQLQSSRGCSGART